MAEVEALAASRRIALMCAEAVPERCHRRLLADAFTVRGWSVRHVLDGGCAEHRLTPFARPSGARILYPADGQTEQAGCEAGRPVIGRARSAAAITSSRRRAAGRWGPVRA